jgi:L-threonylcarbamoyladenylate synthase
MKVVDCSPESILEAGTVLEEGGLVVYPTETAYALGADALNEQALSSLLTAKQRPSGIPILVIISHLHMIEPYADLDERTRFLVETFMPGPLTLAVPKKPPVPDLLNPEGISFRISSCEQARTLADAVGTPITGTSANLHGTGLIYDPPDIVSTFDTSVDLFLNGGTLTPSPPSTVIDMKSTPPTIIREGAIPFSTIVEALTSFTERGGRP